MHILTFHLHLQSSGHHIVEYKAVNPRCQHSSSCANAKFPVWYQQDNLHVHPFSAYYISNHTIQSHFPIAVISTYLTPSLSQGWASWRICNTLRQNTHLQRIQLRYNLHQRCIIHQCFNIYIYVISCTSTTYASTTCTSELFVSRKCVFATCTSTPFTSTTCITIT